MAGISDVFGRLNLGLALWNGRDPILKERMFGLTNSEGNHGEDVKEYWWYLDALPSSAWLRWRYHYPQAAFPVRGPDRGERPALEAASRSTSCSTPASSTTTATGSSRSTTRRPTRPTSWRGSPSATAGPRRPRSTCCRRSGSATSGRGTRRAPHPTLEAAADGTRIHASHPGLGDYELHVGTGARTAPSRSCCSARTRPTTRGSSATAATTPYPKDGINDHVVAGADDRQPGRDGHEGGGRGTASRSSPARPPRSGSACGRGRRPPPRPRRSTRPTSWARRSTRRWRRASPRRTTFYADLRRPGATADEAMVMRQAFAGMLWSKQFYAYDVARWLDGDPGEPAAAERAADRSQRRLAPLRRRGHPLDARQVGVPVVRGLGPRVPRDHARPRRPGVREVPAARHVPGVVPAPQRRPARVRVVVRRRQPAGPRAGRARRLEHRRRGATPSS